MLLHCKYVMLNVENRPSAVFFLYLLKLLCEISTISNSKTSGFTQKDQCLFDFIKAELFVQVRIDLCKG